MRKLLPWPFRRREHASCSEIVEFASGYLDEPATLPEGLVARIRHHLAQCPPCERFINTLRATILLLGKLPRSQAPPGLEDRIKRSIARRHP